MDGFQACLICDVANTAASLYVQLFMAWIFDLQDYQGQAVLNPEFYVCQSIGHVPVLDIVRALCLCVLIFVNIRLF